MPTKAEQKYWLKPGVLASYNGTVVQVDRLDKRKFKSANDGKPVLLGVYCSWVDAEGVRHTRKFHSRELVRYVK